jgi:hypothetical protein
MRASLRFGVGASLLLAAPAARAEYPDCISGVSTAASLSAWRAGAIKAAHGTGGAVATSIRQCFGANVPACLQRVNAYAGRYDVASASADPPIQEVPARNPPPELLAPGAADNLTYFVPPNIEAIAKQKGWLAVRYKSRHSGGFDAGTPSLLMVYVPGASLNPTATYDRWLNFALPADDEAEALNPVPQKPVPTAEDYAREASSDADYPRTFTMVSLERATDTQPAQLYFQMFRRQAGDKGLWSPQPNANVSACFTCHPNGMRAISPLGYHVRAGEAALPPEAWQTVKAINDAMADAEGGKIASWRGAKAAGGEKPFLKPAANWPIMGPLKPFNKISRTQAFIMGGTLPDGTQTPGCYKRRAQVDVTDIFGRPPGANNRYQLAANPAVDWQKVKSAMACEGCHNNRDRYAITASTDAPTVDFKILVDQAMPFGFHQDPLDQGSAAASPIDRLTPDERIALANCLVDEMGEEQKFLDNYLAQGACQ